MPPLLLPTLPLLLFLLLLGGSTEADPDLQILLDLKSSLMVAANSSALASWSPGGHPCNFSGILCDSQNSVAEIDLSGRDISGSISFHSLCQLPSLTKLSFGHNNLTGKLTADVRNCTQLQHLDLAFNALTGVVPDLSPLTKLRVLNVSDNNFSGQFPWDSLRNLSGLVALSVGDNGFGPSPFPQSIKNLIGLELVYLSDSNLHGLIPPWIGNLTALVDLQFADNFISGGIPPEITKLRSLYELEMYNNTLTGEFPPGFGNLSNLAYFDASMNFLEGDLSEIRFLTKLVSLQLFFNGFSGEVPPEFGEFQQLVNLSLYTNRLSGQLPEKLGSWSEFNFIDVSTNFFTGRIPPDMCRMGTMQKLLMLENQFSGEIPASYGNCSTLLRFRVSNNSLSGDVPAGIWSLPNVNIIDLAINQLEGTISAGIGKAKSLNQLLIGNNRFSGDIPPEIAGASLLVSIDAPFNQFSGGIPTEIGTLKHLASLDLEQNSFSGEIPDSMGSCVSLNTMNLAKNAFSGQIPASLGELPSLNSLDLSNNQLSGQIPSSLVSLKLSALDLSNNLLSGAVPAAISIAAFNESFSGNPNLCGDGVEFLRQCSAERGGGSGTKFRTTLTCFLAVFACVLAFLGYILLFRKRRSDGRNLMRDSWDLKSFRILTFDEKEIVDSIKRENLIGKGGSGSVYRVSLGSGKVVAVKHICAEQDSEEKGTVAMLRDTRPASAAREFEAEVGTLSSIRHVNVVKLYCSITCEGWRLLVYEHLPNGSLWDRLHSCEVEKLAMDWDTRADIAVGAARGLEYLHHGCDRPILHRDVKSSNILLDEDFKPRIADFGLAKVLQSGSGWDDSTHVIAGTHGYIAPEYAYTWKVSEKSDVYSFGVVLMELVTGRRPIEPEYGENKDIVYWVSKNMTSKESVMGLLDKRIPQLAEEEALKVLRIGVLCTARLPAMRPSMRNVVQMLEEASIGRTMVEVHDKEQQMRHEDGYRINVDENFENVRFSL